METNRERKLSREQRKTLLKARKILDNFYDITKLSDEELSLLASAEMIVQIYKMQHGRKRVIKN